MSYPIHMHIDNLNARISQLERAQFGKTMTSAPFSNAINPSPNFHQYQSMTGVPYRTSTSFAEKTAGWDSAKKERYELYKYAINGDNYTCKSGREQEDREFHQAYNMELDERALMQSAPSNRRYGRGRY